MITILKNSNKIAYGIKKFLLDKQEELDLISLSTANPGSTAFVVENGLSYVLTNDKKWIQIPTGSCLDNENIDLIGLGGII